jgi:hypothetical protein
MVEISCFYNHFNTEPISIIFIKFECFIQVILNNKAIILTNLELVSNNRLFQLFKLSLLCTEDTSYILSYYINDNLVHGISTQWYWKNMGFTDYYGVVELKYNYKRNLFNKQEPKRASSPKKIRKFMKLFNSFYIIDKMKAPNQLIREYYSFELLDLCEYFKHYIEYNKNNKQIQLLTSILHNYGRDIYHSIRQHL